MILSFDQIKEILKDNPGSKRIAEGVEYSKKLRMHISGVDLGSYIKLIEGYESSSKARDLRAQYTKSNKDLFSRLSRPIDKVFTAKGGSVTYNLTDAQERTAAGYESDVRSGYSVKKWVETFWKPHMLDDPYSVTFMEILPKQEAILAKRQGRSFVYPTYKPTSCIFDYLPSGNKLEWIVFRVERDEKKKYGIAPDSIVYRVVDDAMDYLIKRDGENFEILNGPDNSLSIPNYFGFVPGIINSDLISPVDENCFLSFFDDVVELAQSFLLKGSIKGVHDFLHGFPKYAEFGDICPTCNGTTYHDGDSCKDCRGTGKKIMLKVSDAKLLEYPTKDQPVILPNQVAGYISPDKTYHEIATSDLQGLENAMFATLWGVQPKTQAQPMTADQGGQVKTATEVIDDMKPQADRLMVISEMAEKRHKFILDAVVRLNMNLTNYGGSSVTYGRRYLLEGPDKLWAKYAEARAKGSPGTILDSMLIEYLEAEYQANPLKLEVEKKMVYVEPFVHVNVANVKALNPDPVDYKGKLYFNEWMATMNNGALLTMTVEQLRKSLADYVSTKKVPEQQLDPAKQVA